MLDFPEKTIIKSDFRASLSADLRADLQSENKELCCEETHNHGEADKLLPTRSQLLSVEKAQGMAKFMNFLADTNRLRILSVLATGEMCVGDLTITEKFGFKAPSFKTAFNFNVIAKVFNYAIIKDSGKAHLKKPSRYSGQLLIQNPGGNKPRKLYKCGSKRN